MADQQDFSPSFMLMMGVDNQEFLVNLSQIRAVQKISDDHVRILFGLDFTLEVHGKGAQEVLAYCVVRSVLADGTPCIELIEKWQKEHEKPMSE